MITEQEKLKPCPFCGGGVKLEEVKMRSGTWYGVKCRNTRNLGGDCTMEQVPSRTPEAAVSRWNMRRPEDELRAEIDRLKGLRPDAPPRPPDGAGLPRYGLRWNGPQHPLAVPMDDGYWTPWHLAERKEMEGYVNGLMRAGNLKPRIAKGEQGAMVLNDIRAQIDEAIEAATTKQVKL